MRKKRFSVEQMIGVLKQSEVGVPVAEVIQKAGISEGEVRRFGGGPGTPDGRTGGRKPTFEATGCGSDAGQDDEDARCKRPNGTSDAGKTSEKRSMIDFESHLKQSSLRRLLSPA